MQVNVVIFNQPTSLERSDFFEIASDFELDKIDKQLKINLSSNRSRRGISVVLSDSKDIYLVERKDANFYPFLYCVCFL